MATQTELMALSMPAKLARCIGSDVSLTVAAAGNASQANATQIIARYNLVLTSGASTNSVILKSASESGEVVITLASAQTTLNIYPAVGETIVDEGAQGAPNAAITLAAAKLVTLFPVGNVWFASRGA